MPDTPSHFGDTPWRNCLRMETRESERALLFERSSALRVNRGLPQAYGLGSALGRQRSFWRQAGGRLHGARPLDLWLDGGRLLTPASSYKEGAARELHRQAARGAGGGTGRPADSKKRAGISSSIEAKELAKHERRPDT